MTITDEELDRLSAARFELASGSAGRKNHDWSRLPDGPGWPVVAQSIGLVRYRHRFVPWLHRKYGDVFTVRLVPGPRPLVLFTKPEHSREIFAGDPEIFHAGKGNSILGPIMGEHSLLLQDSGEHKRARRLLMPAFNGHALRGYQDLVTEVARDEVATWRSGEEFRALDRMNALTLEVILRVVFGVADEQRLAALRPTVQKIVDINPALLLGWAFPRLRRLRPWQRLEENQRRLDRLMYDEIAERREVPDLAERTDVLSQLIRSGEGEDALTDTELRDQLVTLLLAGHETTATALAWSLYELGRSPALLDRSRAAARDGDDAWLEAVLKESMRLHPVIPMVVRQLMAPVTIGGIDLPTGIFVGTSILIAHAREDNHADPLEFRPERFLDHNPPANTWIPFGGGVRRCIGAGFSLMEGTAALREILKEYAVTAVGDEQPKVRNITSVPEKGARIRVG
ncbi:cytochrome P450 [Nocardioides speluncae]|uniref:cytochrome P450 n=1 Tax=Nocardioides speluncae TaxID=2670337 RepID=UPI000D6906D3|nr:cytochrome P450 [Nocardioides speluncae]